MNFSQYTKEFRYNIQLAYPVIIGMLGHTLIAIVDNIMVGKLGSTELAAVLYVVGHGEDSLVGKNG